MHLSLNEDQRQVLDFIDSLARPYAGVPLHDAGLTLESAELDAALVENGFLDVLMVEELGPVTAALVVEKLARLPFAVEAAASSFVRPLSIRTCRVRCVWSRRGAQVVRCVSCGRGRAS
ncbi:hypothetical protein ACFSLT_16480 [Novosphingobium resinovorum]